MKNKARALNSASRIVRCLVVPAFILNLAGCDDAAERIAVKLFYRAATLPKEQIHLDLVYWTGRDQDPRKHVLDLYVPVGAGWPVLLFVHGGNWRSGDKALHFGDADPYGNIGRFYAARGIGVAVMNYRLQSEVTWREQVRDVARALDWVHKHARDYGADQRAIFISGHSSGAQLAARTAVDSELLDQVGLGRRPLCGVIAVSGAPYDIADDETYKLGTNPARFEKAFRTAGSGDRWRYEASAVNFITDSTSPFLLIVGRWEPRGLKRQNRLMHGALRKIGVSSRLVETPWDGHFLTVASMSRPDKAVSREILQFIRAKKCFQENAVEQHFNLSRLSEPPAAASG